MIRRLKKEFGARLLVPKCAVRGCQELGFPVHARLYCRRHLGELARYAFVQRLDRRGLLGVWTMLYGKKVPAEPREL